MLSRFIEHRIYFKPDHQPPPSFLLDEAEAFSSRVRHFVSRESVTPISTSKKIFGAWYHILHQIYTRFEMWYAIMIYRSPYMPQTVSPTPPSFLLDEAEAFSSRVRHFVSRECVTPISHLKKFHKNHESYTAVDVTYIRYSIRYQNLLTIPHASNWTTTPA